MVAKSVYGFRRLLLQGTYPCSKFPISRPYFVRFAIFKAEEIAERGEGDILPACAGMAQYTSVAGALIVLARFTTLYLMSFHSLSE
jgi:hypothetical protein